MILAELREKHHGDYVSSRRTESNTEQAVRVGIDSNIQPPLRIELNHGFIDRNLIRICTVCRL